MASNYQETVSTLTEEQLSHIKNTIALSLHNWARDIAYRNSRAHAPSKLALLDAAIRAASTPAHISHSRH